MIRTMRVTGVALVIRTMQVTGVALVIRPVLLIIVMPGIGKQMEGLIAGGELQWENRSTE